MQWEHLVVCIGGDWARRLSSLSVRRLDRFFLTPHEKATEGDSAVCDSVLVAHTHYATWAVAPKNQLWIMFSTLAVGCCTYIVVVIERETTIVAVGARGERGLTC